jgi:hypothetical protein
MELPKCAGEGGRSKELISSKQRLERQKGWQQVGDKPLPETAGSSQQSSSPEPVSTIQSQTTLKNWKIISKPSQHSDSRGPADGSLTFAPEKGGEAKKQALVIKHSENPTPKQDSWWATEVIPEPEDNIQT